MDLNACDRAEKLLGKSFLSDGFWDDLSTGAITAIFWACITETSPDTTITSLRQWPLKAIGEMSEAVRAAFRVANDIPEDTDRPTSGSGKEQPDASSR